MSEPAPPTRDDEADGATDAAAEESTEAESESTDPTLRR